MRRKVNIARLARRIGARLRRWPGFRNYPLVYLRSTVAARPYAADFAGVRAYVMFLGYPRSAHSVVGALLDAHPNMLVAHELDALKFVAGGFSRRQLFSLLVERDREWVGVEGLWQSGYHYEVPGQWQGRWDRLDVIGDKKGGHSSMRLQQDPRIIDKLAAAVDLPVKIIHVVRNPYDNIATMARYTRQGLLAVADEYLGMAEAVARAKARHAPGDWHDLHGDDLAADPEGRLADLCRFLGVTALPGYLGACAALVYPSTKRTRDAVTWTRPVLDRIAARSADAPWLDRYAADVAVADS